MTKTSATKTKTTPPKKPAPEAEDRMSSFRLTAEVIETLTQASKATGLSRTEFLSRAVRYMAKASQQNPGLLMSADALPAKVS